MEEKDEVVSTGQINFIFSQQEDLQLFRRKNQSIFDTLTHREIEVLKLIADGMNNVSIAEFLGVARVTIQNHRASIREKLCLKTEPEYFKYALAFDLITF